MSFVLKTVVSIALIGGLWWSMAALALSSEAIQSGVSDVLPRSQLVESDAMLDVIFYDDVCCRDFNTGLAWSFVMTIVGGLPAAGVAAILRRRMKRGYVPSPTLQPMLLAAFVLQFASLTLNALLALMWLADPRDFIGHPGAWMFVLTTVASAAALPVWHSLRQAAARTDRPQRRTGAEQFS